MRSRRWWRFWDIGIGKFVPVGFAVCLRVQRNTERLGIALPYILCSLDLSLSYHRLFGPLKDHLRGHHYDTEEAVQEAVRSWLRGAGTDLHCIVKSLLRWQKCIDRDGDLQKSNKRYTDFIEVFCFCMYTFVHCRINVLITFGRIFLHGTSQLEYLFLKVLSMKTIISPLLQAIPAYLILMFVCVWRCEGNCCHTVWNTRERKMPVLEAEHQSKRRRRRKHPNAVYIALYSSHFQR
jgi:hypothetical protein